MRESQTEFDSKQGSKEKNMEIIAILLHQTHSSIAYSMNILYTDGEQINERN